MAGGTPKNHPFIDGIFHEINHPAMSLGVPTFMEISLHMYNKHKCCRINMLNSKNHKLCGKPNVKNGLLVIKSYKHL